MEFISVFEMLKIGVGPSSSHTLGPWRAAEQFLAELNEKQILKKISRVEIDLFGSLSLTGKGHATDVAVVLGLSGENPETIAVEKIQGIIQRVKSENKLALSNKHSIAFEFEKDIVFNKKFLPFHANALTFKAYYENTSFQSTFY